jgi:hypothetical protein
MNRKRIMVSVAALNTCMWLAPALGPYVVHRVQVLRHDGVWCAKYNDDGSTKFYRYGLYCDPNWARKQSGP